MATDKRTDRAWIKAQLKDDLASWQASDIVARWKDERRATVHLTRAIIVYEALQRGDLTPLLNDFPMLRQALGTGTGIASEMPTTPGKPIKRRAAQQKTIAEDQDDFLSSLGLG